MNALQATFPTGRTSVDLLVRAQFDEGLSDEMATSKFWYFESRPEFFADPALLREGVVKALDPFLPPEIIDRKPL